MSITQDIKEFALDLGFSRVGITTAEPFEPYAKAMAERSDMYAFYIGSPRQPLLNADPGKAFPAARSIISVAYDYTREAFPKSLLAMVARIYLARCYFTPEHRINGARHELMNAFLERQGCTVSRGVSWLPERSAAARAGVARIGKNTFASADGIGSFIVLGSFVVDAELEYDAPAPETGCPDDCRRCMDACPTGAIYQPHKLDPRRCIGYNQWFTNGRPGVSSFIPFELREKMGIGIHGCDACQEACPRNQRRLKMELPGNPYLEAIAKDFTLPKVLAPTEAFYQNRIQPIMYNYIREKRVFQRNAAIALGNLGDPQYVPQLSAALEDPEPMVRGHAAWALGRIGGAQARQALAAGLGRETSLEAREELEAALAQG
jgi:epoxyqueuosine reductase